MMGHQQDYMSRHYPESRFGGFTDIDGTIAFYTRIHALLAPSALVLDVGCGRGAYGEDPVGVRRALRIFKGKCRRVIGIDVDPRAAENPFLDAFHAMNGSHWPVEDASVDLLVCDSVLEHVEQPEPFFQECRRTLKPGGYLCIRTSNALSYISLLARLIPNRFHAAVLDRALATRRKTEDIFPTVYRCNTRGRLRPLRVWLRG